MDHNLSPQSRPDTNQTLGDYYCLVPCITDESSISIFGTAELATDGTVTERQSSLRDLGTCVQACERDKDMT